MSRRIVLLDTSRPQTPFTPRSQTPVWERLPGNSVSSYNAPMTRTRYRIFETEYPYFMTCTIVG